MKLSQLATKPQLILVQLDDEEVIKEFNEPLEFYTWDRQPLEVFMQLAASDNNADQSVMLNLVKSLILDEAGNQIIVDENMLPPNLLIKAISKITETLGK